MRRESVSGGSVPVVVRWLLVTGLVIGCASAGPSGSESVLEATDVPDGSSAPSASPAIATAATGTGASASPVASPGGSASASPGASASAAPSGPVVPFRLTARAFIEGGAIPREYTCDGENVSPALSWSGVPAGATALVLLVDDPDAKDFVHWIVLDMPAAPAGALPRALDGLKTPPRQGRNDFGDVGWGGPCPPSGSHRYRFVLYALAAPLGVTTGANGTTVRAALAAATVLGQATLEVTYRRG
jgi:Raf kinase inhibitor-like YbhB/YbcL family protein